MPSYSYASEAWFRYTAERVTEVVEAVGAYAPAAGHVIGYHIGAGDSGEWLGPYFWEAYIDCSPVNRQRFSAFLAERYGTYVVDCEIVGLTPAKALVDCAEFYLKARDFDCHKQVMEYHLLDMQG